MFRFLPVQPMTPAFKTSAMLALFGLLLAAEAAAWFAYVPRVISVQTFVWLSVLAATTTIAASATMMGARPTRSIAHVLYDVEHPGRLPKS